MKTPIDKIDRENRISGYWFPYYKKYIPHRIKVLKLALKDLERIKTEGTKRVLHMSDAALNDAKQALVDLEAKHSQLGLNRAGVESKFYSEGALGELNPTLKTVLDILKGISSVRGR